MLGMYSWRTIKRMIKFWWQRRTRGWDDSEIWNLDYTIAKFVLPRLKRFRKVNGCYPPDETPKSWDKKLDKMIYAFHIYSEYNVNYDNVNWKEVIEGLKLFGKHFFHLWW